VSDGVICPSAKMQTTRPSRMLSLAMRNERIMSRGRRFEEIGIRLHQFCEWLMKGES